VVWKSVRKFCFFAEFGDCEVLQLILLQAVTSSWC